MKFLLLCLSSLAIFLLVACEKTIESETNRWNSNQARLERLISEYPNLSAALQSQLTEARSLYEAAKGITDEESRISKMAEANSAAAPYFVSTLDNMDKKIEELRAISAELFEDGNDKSIMVAGIKYMNIESTILEAKDYLSKTAATDKYQADQVVRKASDKIQRMTQRIKDGIKKIEAEKNKPAEEQQTEDEYVQ